MEVAGSFDRIGRVAVADTIEINRAPVPTLWAAAATERLGFDHATALTLAQTLAVSAPMPKGVSRGISEPKPSLVREQGERIEVLAKATLIGAAQLGYFVSGGKTIVRASTDADAAPEGDPAHRRQDPDQGRFQAMRRVGLGRWSTEVYLYRRIFLMDIVVVVSLR